MDRCTTCFNLKAHCSCVQELVGSVEWSEPPPLPGCDPAGVSSEGWPFEIEAALHERLRGIRAERGCKLAGVGFIWRETSKGTEPVEVVYCQRHQTWHYAL